VVLLDEWDLLPAFSEAEGFSGADGGEADQEERVDDVVI
jgi:hypothetical protein